METNYLNDPHIRDAVQAWQVASQRLEALKAEELISINVHEVLESLDDLFEDAIRRFPPQPYSGLIEQQAWFKKLRDEEIASESRT